MASFVSVVHRYQEIPADAAFTAPQAMDVPAEAAELQGHVVTVGMRTMRKLETLERVCNVVKGIFLGIIYILTLTCCLGDREILQLFAKHESTYYHFEPANAMELCSFISERALPKYSEAENKERGVVVTAVKSILDQISPEIMDKMNHDQLLSIVKILNKGDYSSEGFTDFVRELMKRVCNDQTLLQSVLKQEGFWLAQCENHIFADAEMYPAFETLLDRWYGEEGATITISVEQAKHVLKALTIYNGEDAEGYKRRLEVAYVYMEKLNDEVGKDDPGFNGLKDGLRAALKGDEEYLERYRDSVPDYRNSSPYQNGIDLTSLKMIATHYGHPTFSAEIDEILSLPRAASFRSLDNSILGSEGLIREAYGGASILALCYRTFNPSPEPV